jgi:hypothetical protein
MRHARARLEKATVLREIVVVLVLRSPSASFAAWDAGPHVRPGFTLPIDMGFRSDYLVKCKKKGQITWFSKK